MIRTSIALCLLLCGCSSTKVNTDFDQEYDFSGKRTYAWTEGVPSSNELNEKRIVSSVDDALAARGLVPVEGDGAPDLLVLTEVARRQEVRSSGSNVNVGMSRRTSWGGVGWGTSSGQQIYEVTVGTLVIEILDGANEEVVWRAVAEKTVTENPEKTAKVIAEVVAKAFADFPPGG